DLRAKGRSQVETVSIGLLKGNGGVQRFPRAGWRLALKCKRRELDSKTHRRRGESALVIGGAEWKDRHSMDKSYSRDNRLIFPKELTSAEFGTLMALRHYRAVACFKVELFAH
ncbi:hypothetical protein HAX54_007929, partial [Datura stramonium]|nr:hypothetical protein [Datura stramonium]